MTEFDHHIELGEKRALYNGYSQLYEYRLRHRLYRGGMSAEITREVIVRGGAVFVLPYDPVRDELVMIQQFRIGPYVNGGQPWSLEVVAGMVETGEAGEDVACREAREEAGIEFQDITHAFDFYSSPGITTEHMSIYYARTDAALAGGYPRAGGRGRGYQSHCHALR